MAKAKVFALAMRAAQEEGELATLTFEGVQQLLGTTGMLPRRVQLPQSIRYGLGTFFETPKSYGEMNYPSLWSGIGGVHWSHLPFFKKLSDSEKNGTLTFDKGAYWDKTVKFDKLSLLKIITDQNFDALSRREARRTRRAPRQGCEPRPGRSTTTCCARSCHRHWPSGTSCRSCRATWS